jgi:hypothetical protein
MLGRYKYIQLRKLRNYKSPGSDQIPGELIQAGGEILLSAIQKLIHSVWNKEEFPDQWKESIIVPVHKTGHKLTVIMAHDKNRWRALVNSVLNLRVP